MHDRFTRFNAMPFGAVIPPPPVPPPPVPPMARWLVRMVVEDLASAGELWKLDLHVWAFSSTDAVARARADFYGTWATQADRAHLPLHAVAVLQVAV